MKASEILRGLADQLDAIAQPQAASNHLTQVSVDNVDHTEPGEKMIPPLQQKIELLKKAVGVESEFDNQDEMVVLRKNAGMPAMIHMASDDEPLDM
jgi:hypothetical protein